MGPRRAGLVAELLALIQGSSKCKLQKVESAQPFGILVFEKSKRLYIYFKACIKNYPITMARTF